MLMLDFFLRGDYDINEAPDDFGIGWGDVVNGMPLAQIADYRQEQAGHSLETLALYDLGLLVAGIEELPAIDEVAAHEARAAKRSAAIATIHELIGIHECAIADLRERIVALRDESLADNVRMGRTILA